MSRRYQSLGKRDANEAATGAVSADEERGIEWQRSTAPNHVTNG